MKGYSNVLRKNKTKQKIELPQIHSFQNKLVEETILHK